MSPLYKLDWCSSYMFDKIFQQRFERKEQRFEQILQNDLVYLKEFAWLNTSPNHKFFYQKVKNSKLYRFLYALVLAVNQ